MGQIDDNSEKRPADFAEESAGIAAEAAELAEHIRDADPRYRREEQFDMLIEMIDDAHECSLTASVRLDS